MGRERSKKLGSGAGPVADVTKVAYESGTVIACKFFGED